LSPPAAEPRRARLRVGAAARGWLQVARSASLSALLLGCGDPAPPPPAPLPALPPLADAAAPRGPVRPPRALTLAVVGEVRGEIEPCGCPTLPFGGFARRAAALRQLEAEGPLLQLDAGELLVKGNLTTDAADRAERARLVRRLSSAVGLDLWSIGPTDLWALRESGDLDAVLASRSPAVVGAGWQRLDAGPPLPPAVVLREGDLQIGVIGVSSPAEAAGGAPPGWAALAPAEALRRGLDALPPDLDLVLAIGDLDEGEAERLAQTPGLALVLSTAGRALDAPKSPRRADGAPGALVVEVPDRGRYLQVLRLELGAPGDQPLVELPAPEAWRARATARAVAQQRGVAPAAGVEAPFLAEGPGRNLVMVERLPLAADLDLVSAAAPGGPEIAAALAAHRAATVEAAAEAAAAPPTPAAPGYAGGGACARCHSAEVARWALTPHAHAWLALVSADRGGGLPATADPECARCHTTGFGAQGGLGALEGTELNRLKAVQCEACHGPMRGHPDAPVTPAPISAARCVGCHDAANSPNFDYATYLPKASCQGGAPAAPPPGTLP
jgi:hypothetical protein